MEEIWKDIIGFEQMYQVSNFGNIKGLNRIVGKRIAHGKILPGKLDKYGYKHLGLYKNNKGYWFTFHRLVGLHFIDNPNNYPQINHKDGNKLNNNVNNLEWCTGKQNQQHALKLGLREKAIRKGENSNFSKLKLEDILFIRDNYNKKTLNQKELGKMFNVNDSNISQILSFKTWKNI